MTQKNYFHFFAFVTFLFIVSMACVGGAVPNPTQLPTILPPTQPVQPTEPAAPAKPANNSTDLQIFTDQNNLYQVEVPADWTYNQTTGEYHYADILISPDESIKVENIVYNDGKPFTGSQNGKFALKLLHAFYSETGKEGDIRVTGDSLMDDGSERLTWTSRSGGYSGVSFFEIRGSDRKIFLMFTVYWLDTVESRYQDVIDNIVQSYHVP